MDAILSEMIDHHAVTKLVVEHRDGCDRHDALNMGSVYTEEAWDVRRTQKMHGTDFADESTTVMAAGVNICSHQLGQTPATVTGDATGAETSFIATLRRPSDSGVERLNHLGGRYVGVPGAAPTQLQWTRA